MTQGSYVCIIRLLMIGFILTTSATIQAQFYINEIAWDCGGGTDGGPHLAGSDFRDEYIEVRGTPGASLANHYLIFVEAEDNDTHTGLTGQIESIFDLSTRSMGSNGFLTVRQKGNYYNNFYGGIASGTTDLVQVDDIDPQTPETFGFGSGATSAVGFEGEDGKVSIENSGWTAMIVRNNGPIAARPTIGLDLDVGNDGLDPPDLQNANHWASNWTIVDSIGLFTEGFEPYYGRTYSPLTFGTMAIGELFVPGIPESAFTTPNIEPGGTYVFAPWAQTEREIEYVARWGNSTGHTPDDWHIVNVTQRTVAGSVNGAPDYRVSGDPHPNGINEPPPQNQVVESNKNVPYRTPLFNTLGQPNYPVMIDGSLPGDYNEDGKVDSADYVVWRNGVGQAPFKLANESATPGFVTPEDFTLWRSQFGLPGPGSGGENLATRVPEPAGWLLVVWGVLGVGLTRRAR